MIVNNGSIAVSAGTAETPSYSFSSMSLCSNSTNTGSAPTATVIKCGNFKLWLDLVGAGISVSAPIFAKVYVMFKPQSMVVDGLYPVNHPEYIMAWRSVELSNAGLQNVSIQSKLKRNLNSGDSVVALVVIQNYSTLEPQVNVGVNCSYVCCNN